MFSTCAWKWLRAVFPSIASEINGPVLEMHLTDRLKNPSKSSDLKEKEIIKDKLRKSSCVHSISSKTQDGRIQIEKWEAASTNFPNGKAKKVSLNFWTTSCLKLATKCCFIQVQGNLSFELFFFFFCFYIDSISLNVMGSISSYHLNNL